MEAVQHDPENIARLFRYALRMRTMWPSILPCGLRALVGLTVAVLLGCGADEPVRPNLVLITVDRLAADRLGCFGGSGNAGSGLCDLGRRGTRFLWALTPSLDEATAAASTLTGLPPKAHEIDDRGLSFLAEAHETIAESLRRAGYTTAAFVASPRLNRSRRLDQGFLHYADRAAPLSRKQTGGDSGEYESESVARASAIQKWIENAPQPYFVWIHARSERGLPELDRLVDRLVGSLERDEDSPGVLVAALAGEPERVGAFAGSSFASRNAGIELRSYRIPLLWRPPAGRPHPATAAPPPTSLRLASLLDVAPTLRAAALLPAPESDPAVATWGFDLSELTTAADSPDRTGALDTRPHPVAQGGKLESEMEDPQEHYLLIRGPSGTHEVGLASDGSLYVRRSSPLDGSGQPVPTSELSSLSPRFLAIESGRQDGNAPGPAIPTGGPAGLHVSPWRTDVLSVGSPVPRLEFHLARRLAEEGPGRAAR